MGTASPCTCNYRICNYHKENGYGFKTGAPVIDKSKQIDALNNVLAAFMDHEKSPMDYFKTAVKKKPNTDTDSTIALNDLRDKIQSATQTPNLNIVPFCINISDSYKSASEKFIAEKYTPIECKSSRIYSILSCVLIGIILLIFIGYLVYRYINCPCRKRREKELREAEKALLETEARGYTT